MPPRKRSFFHVRELDCADEAATLRAALAGRPGVFELRFDFLRSRLEVDHDPQQITAAQIMRSVAATGMHVRPWQGAAKAKSAAPWRLLLTVLSGAALATGFWLHWLGSADLWLALGAAQDGSPATPGPARALYGLAVAIGLATVLPRAVSALRHVRADMHVLVCVAVLGAIALGEWLEAAAVSFLFSLALLLDHWSLARARRAIAALLQLAPTTARCLDEEGRWVELPLLEVHRGRRVLVRPGERIPVDGPVVAGESSVNQAPITGESQPVSKACGQEVYAGTINGEGTLEIDVARDPEETKLARILQMVEEAQTRRAPTERWVETFARYYTPAMMSLAAAVAVLPPLIGNTPPADAAYHALVLLVIACPCALVISTPVTMVSALAAAARAGVLIKGGRHLESCAHLRAVAFDKTGTLTYGQPLVEQIIPSPAVSRGEILARAAALEAHSNHPFAQAILHAAAKEGIQPEPVREYRVHSGRGIEALLDGNCCWLGGRRLLREKLAAPAEALAQIDQLAGDGHSVIAVGQNDQLLGFLLVSDRVRPEAAATVSALRQLGVREICLLTGDHGAAASRVAAAAGVDRFLSDALPEDKLREVEALLGRYRRVAMIGDGVNDSPAMAVATVGVAMGAIGTDTALETADVALMADDLAKLPWLVAHARRAARIVATNIALALGIKALFVALALLGVASLWSAIAADMGASLAVILNGLRLCNVPAAVK